MKINGIGVMIGSSLDGIDLVDCSFSFKDEKLIDWSIGKYQEIGLGDDIVSKIRSFHTLTYSDIQELAISISRAIALGVKTIWPERYSHFDYLGVHGITVIHEPEKLTSVQLVDAAFLTNELSIPVVSDFRKLDILFGGQGAPMAPIVEQYIYADFKHFLNLGGIANVSSHLTEEVKAMDVCPFNQVINYFAQQRTLPFDDGGTLAKTGTIHSNLVNAMMTFPFFKKREPKSLGNKWVKNIFIPLVDSYEFSIEDKLASFNEFAVRVITDYFEQNNASGRLLVTGGGAYNTFFIHQLKDRLKELDIIIPSDLVIQSKEAILMAFVAALRLQNIPNFIPSVTGARMAVSGGVIYRPQ